MKVIERIMVVLFLVFFGIAAASASYAVVPVQQYGATEGSLLYSDWYLQYHNELGKEHNGQIYGSPQYRDHYKLWKLVEGFTEKDVRRNPNKILTVPVSGHLAEQASFYSILSDSGDTIPDEVTIGEITYARSAERGAEKLFTVVATQQTIPIIAAPAVTESDTTFTKQALETADVSILDISAIKSNYPQELLVLEIGLGVIIFLLVVALVFLVSLNRKAKKVIRFHEEKEEDLASHFEDLKGWIRHYYGLTELAAVDFEKKAKILQEVLQEFTFTQEDDDLFNAVLASEKPPVFEGRTAYFPKVDGGKKVMLSNGVTPDNNPKNIRASIITHYVGKK